MSERKLSTVIVNLIDSFDELKDLQHLVDLAIDQLGIHPEFEHELIRVFTLLEAYQSLSNVKINMVTNHIHDIEMLYIDRGNGNHDN